MLTACRLPGCAQVVFGDDDENKRGGANSGHTNNQQRVMQSHLLALLEFVDQSHLKGKGVTIRKIKNHLSNVHNLSISRTQVRYSMKKLGLKYMPVKKRKRNMNNFRPERIREFIISYNEIYRHIRDGNQEKWVFVYTTNINITLQTGQRELPYQIPPLVLKSSRKP